MYMLFPKLMQLIGTSHVVTKKNGKPSGAATEAGKKARTEAGKTARMEAGKTARTEVAKGVRME